jgi:hypothetical protein
MKYAKQLYEKKEDTNHARVWNILELDIFVTRNTIEYRYFVRRVGNVPYGTIL